MDLDKAIIAVSYYYYLVKVYCDPQWMQAATEFSLPACCMLHAFISQ